MKSFFQKNWIHFAAIAFFFIVAAIYFKPQLEGYGLKQHDVEQWKGMAHETEAFRIKTGQEALWTNSMFGGMPTTQISVLYGGNYIKELYYFYVKLIPGPFGILLLHLIGFYILALFLRLNPIVAILGSIAFSFASYEIIIIQAGHLTKAYATAMLPPLLGAFIYAFRTNRWWGVAFAGLFMTLELAMNHVQVTYYFFFVLGFVGIYFLIRSISKKELKSFLITSGGLIAVFILALGINNGNLTLTNEYAPYTIRGANDVSIAPDGLQAKNQSSGLDKDYITNWSYGIGETFTLLSPNVKGGGSFVLGGSQFEDVLDNSELPSNTINELKNYPAYWGEQPFTSGPVYIGVVVTLLAFLGMIFVKSKIKWALLAVTIFAIALSWGKNFMGLTDFFIENVPGYNKFRTVTIILIIVEVTIPLIGILFLDMLIKQRDEIIAKKKQLFIALGVFFVFLLGVKMVGLGDNYSSSSDQTQLASIEKNIKEQIGSMDPQTLSTQYGIDANNPSSMQVFIDAQMKTYEDNFMNLKTIREDIFNASMNRSLIFVFFASIFILLFILFKVPSMVLSGGLLLLTMVDMIPVAHNYLGDQDAGNGYKYWEEFGKTTHPVSASTADYQILEQELALNPKLKSIIAKAESDGKREADELEYSGLAKQNVIDAHKFMALNFETNYRVFDLSGGFQSTKASYFHKSVGGYHGAKLRNINNLIDFHLSNMNSKVYDMLNVKYFIQNTEQGEQVRPNVTALGNAWLVKTIDKYETPNDEIRALGSKFEIENKGKGQMLINGEVVKSAVVYGREKMQYVLPGKDTMNIPISNDINEGIKALFVMDANGKTNLIPEITQLSDTADSFTILTSLLVKNQFKPTEEVVMLSSEAGKLKSTKFSGEGKVTMTSYAPNRITYSTDVKGNQLAVFSEIYYPAGWKAYIDGKEVDIRKVNYLLRGLEIPNGKHKVEFVYEQTTLTKANLIASICSIILLSLIVFVFFKEFKNRSKELNDVKTDKAN